MLTQKLQQKLLQKLSPQQILLMKLLQIPSIALEQRIKQEIEENPALEDSSDPEMSTDEDDTIPETEPDPVEELEKEREDFDITEYLDDDDTPAYRLNANNTSADDEQREVPFASGISFHEVLLQQLGLRRLDERQMQIARYIIGNLDDSGYLNRALSAMVDDLAFTQNIITEVEELSELLSVVQEFDPPGVGARDLRECLMIQLRRFEQTPSVALALLLVDKYFDELTKKHYDKITRRAKLTEEDLRDAVNEILKLNPKPGNSMGETTRANHYIMPDFFVYNKDGELDLQVNSRNAPELRLSRTYVDMLETYAESKTKSTSQKDAVMFIKQKN